MSDRKYGANTAARDASGRFGAGNPGKPLGARHKLSNAFLEALHEDFEANGKTAIVAARTSDPGAYLRVIASLMRKEMEVTTREAETDPSRMNRDELVASRARAAAVLAAEGLADLTLSAIEAGPAH